MRISDSHMLMSANVVLRQTRQRGHREIHECLRFVSRGDKFLTELITCLMRRKRSSKHDLNLLKAIGAVCSSSVSNDCKRLQLTIVNSRSTSWRIMSSQVALLEKFALLLLRLAGSTDQLPDRCSWSSTRTPKAWRTSCNWSRRGCVTSHYATCWALIQ